MYLISNKVTYLKFRFFKYIFFIDVEDFGECRLLVKIFKRIVSRDIAGAVKGDADQ